MLKFLFFFYIKNNNNNFNTQSNIERNKEKKIVRTINTKIKNTNKVK